MNTEYPSVSPARVFGALLMRDARVTRRELPFFLIRTTMQPFMFIIVFGFLLPKMGFMGDQYKTTLLPGILGVSLTMSAIQSVALPMVQDFGWTNEIEDRLLAPIQIPLIAIEKIVVGSIQGLIAGLFVLPVARLIMGPIPGFTLAHAGETVFMALLGSATFSAIGLLMGTAIRPQQIGFMFSLIIAPMLMFGCAYYPWRGLDVIPVMKYAVLINPLVYVAEGLRGVLTPSVPHMNLAVVVAVLIGMLSIIGWLGIRSFVKRAVK
ncbi:MAG TPA: ABC transporter permease [Gemmatimonadaceae bacterium]|nr:ABC transporter permease [Gemmatimonadaceae bacterium]